MFALVAVSFVSVIQIFRRIHVLADDAVDLDRAIFRVAAKADAPLAVIADLCRIEITQIAFSAFDAFPVIQDALFSDHFLPLPFDRPYYSTA